MGDDEYNSIKSFFFKNKLASEIYKQYDKKVSKINDTIEKFKRKKIKTQAMIYSVTGFDDAKKINLNYLPGSCLVALELDKVFQNYVKEQEKRIDKKIEKEYSCVNQVNYEFYEFEKLYKSNLKSNEYFLTLAKNEKDALEKLELEIHAMYVILSNLRKLEVLDVSNLIDILQQQLEEKKSLKNDLEIKIDNIISNYGKDNVNKVANNHEKSSNKDVNNDYKLDGDDDLDVTPSYDIKLEKEKLTKEIKSMIDFLNSHSADFLNENGISYDCEFQLESMLLEINDVPDRVLKTHKEYLEVLKKSIKKIDFSKEIEFLKENSNKYENDDDHELGVDMTDDSKLEILEKNVEKIIFLIEYIKNYSDNNEYDDIYNLLINSGDIELATEWENRFDEIAKVIENSYDQIETSVVNVLLNNASQEIKFDSNSREELLAKNLFDTMILGKLAGREKTAEYKILATMCSMLDELIENERIFSNTEKLVTEIKEKYKESINFYYLKRYIETEQNYISGSRNKK